MSLTPAQVAELAALLLANNEHTVAIYAKILGGLVALFSIAHLTLLVSHKLAIRGTVTRLLAAPSRYFFFN